MYKMKKTIVIFCLCLTGITTGAFADSSAQLNELTGPYLSANLTFFGGGLYLGKMFSKHLGIEVGADYTSDTLYGDEGSIFHVDMKGVLPVGTRGQFFAKLGVGYSNISQTILDTTVTETGFGPTYGVGFGYAFSRHWSATVEANGIYSKSLDSSGSSFHTIPSIGLTYRF